MCMLGSHDKEHYKCSGSISSGGERPFPKTFSANSLKLIGENQHHLVMVAKVRNKIYLAM